MKHLLSIFFILPFVLIASADPIDDVVHRLSDTPNWGSGRWASIEQPESASPDKIMRVLFGFSYFGDGRTKQLSIAAVRDVSIQIAKGYFEVYQAALVKADSHQQIVIFRFTRGSGGQSGWMCRIYPKE